MTYASTGALETGPTHMALEPVQRLKRGEHERLGGEDTAGSIKP